MTHQSADTQEKLSSTTIWLHWIVGVAVMAMLAVGFLLDDFHELISLHKSFGVIVLLIVLVRVVWRIKNGWLIPVGTYSAWESVLAKITHWVLMLGTLIMPISGFIFSGASGHGVSVFGLVLAPTNPDPEHPGKVIAFNPDAAHLFHEVHENVGYLLTAAVVLHIVGSLKHHIIDKDRTLLRMKGQ